MEYLEERKIPPYFEGSRKEPHDNPVTRAGTGSGEADVAAGVLQRVSSFSMLRSTNTVAITQTQEERIESPVEDLKMYTPPHLVPTWRLKDRMKTVGVGLIMCLNIGTDPPDITKPHPCAKLQCWIDPASMSRAKAKEMIGERLQAQYAKWQQQRAQKAVKYRRALDPTVEDVRSLCHALRRQARNERVLLHINGQGVPRPTANGELWFFDKAYTQYIPLCVTDLRQWIGKPSIIVLDCSSAGILMPFLTAPLDSPETGTQTESMSNDMETAASEWVRDTIVLCPTADGEWLPLDPAFPADLFTAILTTPIKCALRWFVRRNPHSMGNLDPEVVDAIPGKSGDRKTPLGELNWIFTAVTDSIAWNVLPKPLFQRLFRQDLLVASMFRNFLLADRILRSLNCSPQSYPPLPPGVCDHPLWLSWDLACETVLCGLIRDGVLGNHVLVTTPTPNEEEDEAGGAQTPPPPVAQQAPAAMTITSPFFSEQLTAFEIWLEFASVHQSNHPDEPLESPEQLPVVLQVLLSQAHRVRALTLLRRFLDLGKWAVNLALSLGIFPYVMKLLQSPEYKQNLVGIWAKILAFDPTCQVDLQKDGVLRHFVDHLAWGLTMATMNLRLDPVEAAEQRVLAASILSAACLDYPLGQNECLRLNLHGTCCALLLSVESNPDAESDDPHAHTAANNRVPPDFRMGLCLCLGNLVKGNANTQAKVLGDGVQNRLFARLDDAHPDVRAAACFALGCFLCQPPQKSSSQPLKGRATQQIQPGGGPSNSPGFTGVMSPGGQASRVIPPQAFVPQPSSGGVNGFPGQLQPALLGNRWQEPQMGMVHPATAAHHSTPGSLQGFPVQLNPQMPAHGMMPATPPSGRSVTLQHGLPSTGGAFPNQVEGGLSTSFSVFDDHNRLTVDLEISIAALNVLWDSSAMVRYEAVMLFARLVEKYLPAFLAISSELAHSTSGEEDSEVGTRSDQLHFSLPESVDDAMADKFRAIWNGLRDCRQVGVHPDVVAACHSVIRFVHEKILRSDMATVTSTPEKNHRREASTNALERLADESASSGAGAVARLPSVMSTSRLAPRSDGPPHRLLAEKPTLRRSTSEFGTAMAKAALENKSSDAVDGLYSLPTSKFFDWKRNTFFAESAKKRNFYDRRDALSPEGAIDSYLKKRMAVIEVQHRKLADYTACLAPKPPSPKKENIYDSFFSESDNAAAKALEEKLSQTKRSLDLKETTLLKNEGAGNTTLIRFHPFEDTLVACDGTSGISVWHYDSGKREFSFDNGNSRGSRFTSSCWMNNQSNSLFVVGCDDGSVRIWDGITFSTAKKNQPARLASAFIGIPNLQPDKAKSGLVLEWQQYSGQLLAAGNSDSIRSWDMHAEKCSLQLQTGSEACVTTLSTAWTDNMFNEGNASSGSGGAGPHLLVAGFSDGALKMFDTRQSQAVVDFGSTSPSRGFRQKMHNYKEHNLWIVSTAFCSYGNMHQIVSGSMTGEIKLFDLRYSKSQHTYSAHRSSMTAMAVHPTIPIAATSEVQFVRIVTMDGESNQVIRNHQVGPVSCLSFHPHLPVLATGYLGNLIHLYKPKKPLVLS